jgi:hypothetical protein
MSRHTPTPIERFKKGLKSLDPKWPINRSGCEYTTKCPVHGGDDHDSMTFTQGDDGRLLVTCHSRNCDYADIMKAVGLRPVDGFPLSGRKLTRPNPKAEGTACVVASPTCDPSTPCEAFEIDPRTGLPVGEGETRVYEYTDENGKSLSAVFITPIIDECGRQVDKIVFQARRVGDRVSLSLRAGWFVPTGEGKLKFVADKTQPRPSEDAILIDEPASRVLYRLPEVIEAVGKGYPIFIVEGEKDVETLRNLDLPATTNPGGAGKWRDEYTEALKGASLVVILPDNDDSGRDHAQDVAERVFDVVEQVIIVELPGLAEKEDVSDWVAQGGTLDDLIDLIASAEPFEPSVSSGLKILDHRPRKMRRPLEVFGGRGHLFTIVSVGDHDDHKNVTVLLSGSGELYCDDNDTLTGSRPLEEAGVGLDLPKTLRTGRLLSGAGLKRAIARDEVQPRDVFHRIMESVLWFFDFQRSLAGQETVAKIITLAIIQTYFLDAFDRIGYLWITGGPGSGKSKLLAFITRLAFLGEFLAASSTCPSVRDIAESGATIGIDDYFYWPVFPETLKHP